MIYLIKRVEISLFLETNTIGAYLIYESKIVFIHFWIYNEIGLGRLTGLHSSSKGSTTGRANSGERGGISTLVAI